MSTTLGLDLGPNSIGWALVDAEKRKIIDLGVRVFPEGVDNFDTRKEKPRNEERRLARMMRRQIRRRATRAHQLRSTLIELGLFPENPTDQLELHETGPYELRAKALDEKISLHELGRVLLHMNQRRGFLSNRKKEQKDGEVKGMLAEIDDLSKEIKQSGSRTLGKYLHTKLGTLDHAERIEDDHIRGRHTQRQMLADEFRDIWEAQSVYHDKLTDELAYGSFGVTVNLEERSIARIVHPQAKSSDRRNGESDLQSFGLFGIIFSHRTLKPVPMEVIGRCELESRLARCARADRAAQRFRLLTEVNNLRLIDSTKTPAEDRELNDQERALLLDKLSKTKGATFDQIRKWIGALPGSPAPDQLCFNLEEGKRKKIDGMVTDAILAAKGAVGPSWRALPEGTKDAAVRELIKSVDDDEAYEILVNTIGLTPEQADGALTVDLSMGPTAGYVRFSLVAIEKLLPHLERGLDLMGNDENDSALHAAGYMRPDELKRRIFDRLPDPKRIKDAPIGEIPNPVVKRAVVELRKVVNAIIREHGRPDAVHVEMTRDVRRSAKGRAAQTARMRENEADRDAAKKFLGDHGQRYGSRGSNILKVRMWSHQGHDCPYCGQKIGQSELFNDGLTEIDHILPYTKTLDDSQMNKVVCHRKCNADKGNQTPYEWLAARDPERYERVCQIAFSMMRSGKMPYQKYRRFTQKELVLDDFIARQLTATGYIAKATLQYIKCLFENEHAVLGLKGQLTAELRWQWGLNLNRLLRDDELNVKTRDDHRHHVVDAIVIALTDRSRLQKLSKIRKSGGTQKTGEVLAVPWDGFRDEVVDKLEMLDGATDERGNRRGISHRVQRKVAGGLHEETIYGPVHDRFGKRQEGTFVVRKALADISPNEIDKIRDDAIRGIIQERLAERDVEFGRGVKNNKKWKDTVKELFCNVSDPVRLPPSKKRLREDPNAMGIPIHKVRVLREEQTIQPIREDRAEKEGDPDLVAWVKPGATHHLCIFEFTIKGKKKRDAIFVTQLEAKNRIKRQSQELARQVKQWAEQGLSKGDIKRHKARAMREIAEKYPLIQRDATKLDGKDRECIPENAAFIMSLSQGELVLAQWKGEEKILKFKTAASTQGQIYFCGHTDARKSSEYKKYAANANTLNARKITIDPLGRVRWTSD